MTNTSKTAIILQRAIQTLAVLAAMLFVTACPRRHPVPASPQGILIQNPYASVDWSASGRFKANLHTHTTSSDGLLTPSDVIDRYHELGYAILAITDHDVVTYPWEHLSALHASEGSQKKFATGKIESKTLEYQDRAPDTLQMMAVQGCEFSKHHHICSYFNDHPGSETEETSLTQVSAKGGIASINHPGRYSKPAAWYIQLYQNHPCLFGLEIFNQGDRYPRDREQWDAILTSLMPDRPVWGYSNDDMHSGAKHLGCNWNIFLLPGQSGSPDSQIAPTAK